MYRLIICLFFATVLLCNTAAQNPRVKVNVKRVWQFTESSLLTPYWIEIENQGPDLTGFAMSVAGSLSQLRYPIEVPSGTTKSFYFLNQNEMYSGGNKIVIRTNQGDFEPKISQSYNSPTQRIGYVGNNPSDISFLSQNDSSGKGNGIQAGGCSIEDLPARSSAFLEINSLVLGEGTERLSNSQIRTIQSYLRTGGVVVFIGGATNSATIDPRWSSYLPLKDSINKATVRRGIKITEKLGRPIMGSQLFQADMGAYSVRAVGLGLVVQLTVDPFDAPAIPIADRRQLLLRSTFRSYKNAMQTMTFNVGTVPESTPIAAAPLVQDFKNDPFQLSPPKTLDIAKILVVYFIAVLPVNFLILRRLKRLELAWYTTPVISAFFSFVLLSSTSQLYSSLSTQRTFSVAAIDSLSSAETRMNRTEMFFPRAGSEPFKIEGFETAYGFTSSSGFTFEDNGRGIAVSAVDVPNLAFREYVYFQELPSTPVFTAELDGKYLRVKNLSKYPLLEVSLLGYSTIIIPTLFPGKEIVVNVKEIIQKQPNIYRSGSDWSFLRNVPGEIVVSCSSLAIPNGPRYGTRHPSSSTRYFTTPTITGELK